MNFEPFDFNPHQPQREVIQCFSSFNHAVCYEHCVLVILGCILAIACLADLIKKYKQKDRLTKQGVIIFLLLLQSITFTLSNFDRVLTFLYYATVYFQGLLLCCILHYYLLKLLKLSNLQHWRSCMIIPLISLIVAVTALQILGVVEKSQNDNGRCKECNFQTLLWFEFSLTMLLLGLGVVLSVKMRSRINELTMMACTVPKQRVMFKRFWFLAVAEVMSTSFIIFGFFYFHDKDNCAIFPAEAGLSVVADGLNQFMITLLPAMFTYLNFRSYKATINRRLSSRAPSQEITLSSGLYFKTVE